MFNIRSFVFAEIEHQTIQLHRETYGICTLDPVGPEANALTTWPAAIPLKKTGLKIYFRVLNATPVLAKVYGCSKSRVI